MNQPSSRDYKSVLHFMENDGGPLFQKESQFTYEKEDLITLRPGREHAWLDGVIERLLQACRCRLITVSPFVNTNNFQTNNLSKYVFCSKVRNKEACIFSILSNVPTGNPRKDRRLRYTLL